MTKLTHTEQLLSHLVSEIVEMNGYMSRIASSLEYIGENMTPSPDIGFDANATDLLSSFFTEVIEVLKEKNND